MEGLFEVLSCGLKGEGQLMLSPPPLDIHSASVETMQQNKML